MRGTLYCEEKPVCVIIIYIIHCAKCAIKCAHILITESIHIEQCQCVQKLLFTLSTIFNLQEQITYVQAEHADVDICIITCSVYQTAQMSAV